MGKFENLSAIVICTLLLTTTFDAGASVSISKMAVVGKSPKGRVVAIEEYSFDQHTKRYVSRIQIIDTWKDQLLFDNQEVSSSVSFEHARKLNLENMRALFNRYHLK
jgi:predicted secreted protein